MKKCFVLATLSSAAFAAGAMGQTDPTIYDNGAGISNSGTASQRDTAYPFLAMFADDLTFAGGATVTGFTADFSFFNGAPVAVGGLEVWIFADAGGVPTGAGLPDPSTTAIGGGVITSFTQTDAGNGIDTVFAGDFDSSFTALPGVTYWMSVVPVFNFPPQTGWNATAAISGNEAVSGFPLLGTQFWAGDGPLGGDAAFTLTGVIPEPASLSMLGLGALGLLRRRR